jgi:hypothetical protein
MRYNDSDFENYLSGKMTSEEKINFETNLLRSPELSNDFNKYKKLKEMISETRSINLSESYSSGILPRFRNKMEARNKSKPYQKVGAFITAATSLVVGFTVTINLFINENGQDLNDLAEIIEGERDSIISSFEISDNLVSKADSESLAKMDSVYNDIISQNIYVEFDFDDFNDLTYDIQNIELEQFITDVDVDKIYTILINKEIL